MFEVKIQKVDNKPRTTYQQAKKKIRICLYLIHGNGDYQQKPVLYIVVLYHGNVS